MKYAWIEQQLDEHSLSRLCRVLEVSRSGYHAWRNRAPSQHAQDDEVLSVKIKAHFEQGRGVCGTRRLKQSLAEEGVEVSRRRIGRLMAEQDLQVKTRRKFKPTTESTHGEAIAPDLLNRQFEVPAPDTAYVGDITYIWTEEGWLYLAVVIDLFSRAVVGWSMSRWITAQLVNAALAMALNQRQPAPGLIMHTDRGSQYQADSYRQRLDEHQIRASMSRKGNCWDNSVAESFFHSLKSECVYLERFATREQAQAAIFDYIEVFYNRQRRHSTIGYLAPLVYEQAQAAAAVSAAQQSGIEHAAPGREFTLLGMVAMTAQRKRCQGREAPAGLGLDSAEAEDILFHAKEGEPHHSGLREPTNGLTQP